MNIYESMNNGFRRNYNLREDEEGKIIDGNQWAAYWNAHNFFGDVNRSTDVGVGRLKDIIADGETRNVVLQGTVGARKIKNVGGTFYDRSDVVSKGRLATNARLEKFRADAEERGFIPYNSNMDGYESFIIENFVPGYNAVLYIATTTRPRTILDIEKNVNGKNRYIMSGDSNSAVLEKVWVDLVNSLEERYESYGGHYGATLDISDLPAPSTFSFFNI